MSSYSALGLQKIIFATQPVQGLVTLLRWGIATKILIISPTANHFVTVDEGGNF